jgi:hypothetical protein
MKKLFKKLLDLPNAFRVLEIMEECGGVYIRKVYRKGFENIDYWEIKPKGYVSQKEAEDLRTIISHGRQYKKRCWVLRFFSSKIRNGYRL